MKAIVSMLVLLASSATCSAADPGSAEVHRPVVISRGPAGDLASSLLQELRGVCQQGGGDMNGVDCDCGDLVFSAEARACVERDAWFFNERCINEAGAARDSCMRLGLFGRGATNLSIALNGPPEAIGEIDDWLEHVAPPLLPRIPPTPEDGSGATIFVTVGDPPRFSGDQIKLAFDNQIFHPQAGSMVPRKGYVQLHARSLSDLAAALGSADTTTSVQLPIQSTNPLLRDLAIAATRVTKPDYALDKAPVYAASSTRGSCLDSCVIQRVILPNEAQNGRRSVLVDRYVRGIRQNREIRLLSPEHQLIEAKLVFDLGDRPSLAYIPSVVRENGKLLTRVRVFDGSLTEVDPSDFVMLEDATLLDGLGAMHTRLADDELAILSFESGYSLQSPASFKWILRGLHSARQPGQGTSLLGWYSAETTGMLEYARGFIPTYQDSPFADRVADDHPYNVNRLLIGSGAPPWTGGRFATTYVIPLGSAIASPMTVHAVRTAAKDHGVRVGSLSVAFSESPEACEISARPLLNSGLLLVSAAGNDGVRADARELCPQRLSPSPDLIVVGAANGGRMEPYSNHGSTLVDIAADGRDPDLSLGGGTSFAAPRVAYAAAQLAKKIPATNAQIRMALLLSAEIPAAAPLPVRSGGQLASDLNYAEVALINLVHRYGTDTEGMAERVPFSVALGTAKQVPGDHILRLKILIENGAVCKEEELEESCRPNEHGCQEIQKLARQRALPCDF